MSETNTTPADPRAQGMGFTDEVLPTSPHVCLIYESDEERRRIVVEYLRAGLARRELINYFTDTTPPETIRAWLEEAGVDVREADARGALRVVAAERAYCPGGSFDPPTLVHALLERYAAAEKAGHTGSRACGEMSWVLRGVPGSERFVEYEARLNTIQAAFPHTGMCQYDARRFDGAALFQVLQVHPFVVADGQIVRNPNYVKPEEFLARAPTSLRRA